MPPRKNVILIPDGNMYHTIPVITCLKKAMNVKVYIVATDYNPKIKFSRYCDGYYLSQQTTVVDRVAELKDIARRHGATYIFPVTEEGTKLIQENINHFNQLTLPPLPSIEQMNSTWDKWNFACFLNKYNINHPDTFLWTEEPGNVEQFENIIFPVLFKPRLSAGGIGIQKFDDLGSLMAFRNIPGNLQKKGVLQQYIEGRDACCSVLCIDGRIVAYTMQQDIGFPRPDDYQCAKAIQFINNPQALFMVSRIMAALKWNGVACLDMKFCRNSGKIFILELNGRYWRTLLGSLSVGINFPHLSIQASQGISFDIPIYCCQNFYTVRHWLKYKIGSYSKNDFSNIKFKYTDFKYVIADPLPRLTGHVIRYIEKYFPDKSKNNEKRSNP